MADPRAEPAIGAGQHVLAADQAGVAHQPLGDEIGVLDEVAAMPDDARDQCRAVRKFHRLENPPFVLMARVRGLDRIASRIDAEDQIDDVPERDVVVMRPVKAAPADMQSHLLARDAAQRMVQRIDPHRRIFAILRERDVGQAVPAVRQIGVVDLQQKAGLDDRAIFLVHGVGDRENEFLVGLIVLVRHPMLDRAGRVGRQEGAGR